MKRKRTCDEDEEGKEQPLPDSEPEPSAEERREPDDNDDAQQSATKESNKRRKLQEKLKKLKQTYESRGKGLMSSSCPKLAKKLRLRY